MRRLTVSSLFPRGDTLEEDDEEEDSQLSAERSSCDVLSIPVPIRRGGSESNLDVVDSVGDDGVGLDFTKGALGIDSLQQKILKVTEQIKVEQTARDQNVAEYLKLVNNADKQQVGRIRQVFEKKNQKSAQSIARLQRKLEQYHRRMKDSETNGKHSHKDGSGKESGTHSKEGSLKDISTTGRHPALDKVKTIGPGVSLSPPFFFNKSREFANLIRNKFGSADNIAHLKSSMEAGSGLQVEGGARGLSGSATTVAKASKYQSDDECSTGTSASADSNGNAAGGSGAGSGGPARSDSNGRIGEVLDMVREIREAQQQLADDMETLNTQFKRDYSYFTQMMQEERYRYERLEDQLNDLTELHQHETSNLKQELASIEEKVAYQAYERARDIQEVLESCQTRVSKLELQQQQNQTVQVENADAKVLLGKCINIMLAIVTVILVCVSTAAKFTAPLLRSRVHLALTCVGLSVLALLWKNWEHLQCALERLVLPH
ncbi:transmembrane and coiled-coil domain protein 3 isoform X1 [Sparus aurata]|uniref:Transmembrane and coiled-coil domain family 3 n=1 Tax=Sparus aurata TaxID=8175 RepID=A0A671X0A1_SPAAU|nr:transmembrane and coiled-coil domain protein 3 isoform X1 [Sparus aurata]XP_030296294.1 transmembrane and coiled-coil domain protein 3 isoform X1 [Sparus aurata]XP_030296295.1 transmembrane and coiled-coil domain protein 3 isoform X1 [Sparus aurata]